MAASKFTFQNLNKVDPNYTNMGSGYNAQDDPYSFFYTPPAENTVNTDKSLRTLKSNRNAGTPGNTGASVQKTTGQGGFDYSMFGTWDRGSSRSVGTAGQSMFGGRINQPTQYKPPTGSVSVTSSGVIKPEGPMPTLGEATPFVSPEKTDIEPVRRKEMGSSYRRLSQVVAQALAGIGDEDVMGTQKRNVLEGFGNTLSEAGQGAYRVARSEGAREDALNLQEKQINWQAGEQTRMASFNAALQNYFKQYSTQTTSAKKYTYDVKGPDEKKKFDFGMTPSAGMGVSSLPPGSKAPAVNLGNVVERYFG